VVQAVEAVEGAWPIGALTALVRYHRLAGRSAPLSGSVARTKTARSCGERRARRFAPGDPCWLSLMAGISPTMAPA
jgi:hypothetical protein